MISIRLCSEIKTVKEENYDILQLLQLQLLSIALDTRFTQDSKLQEFILGISLVGFSTMISVMIFNSRKNDNLIRNLCERIAKLEGMLQERLK